MWEVDILTIHILFNTLVFLFLFILQMLFIYHVIKLIYVMKYKWLTFKMEMMIQVWCGTAGYRNTSWILLPEQSENSRPPVPVKYKKC